MSFFDEDDEPQRTTRTRVRPSPPPRRGRVVGGGCHGWPDRARAADGRRARRRGCCCSCSSSSSARATTAGTRRRCATTTCRSPASPPSRARTATQFFEAMNQGGSQAPADLYQQVIQFKNSADKSLAQARELDVPDDMVSAQQSLLIALELRRDGLTKVAEDVKTALGDEGDAADRAITSIAGPDAGLQRVGRALQDPRDPVRRARNCRTRRRARTSRSSSRSSCATSTGSRDQFVASKLGQQLSGGGDGDGDGRQRRADRSGPARHRPGRDVVRPDDPPAGLEPAHVRGRPGVLGVVHQPGRQRRVQHQGHGQDRARERRLADRRSRRPCSRWPRARRRR